MEFKKINLEKSWNFASDLRHCETNFSRATRAVQVSIIHAFVHLLMYIIFPKFISITHCVINQYMD